MKKPCKISASTMARTAALALALTNQLLSCTGHSVHLEVDPQEGG